MATWEITEPQRLDFTEDVTHLHVALFGGRLNVVGTDGPARVEVAAASELKLIVTLEAGRLSVRHDTAKPWPGVFASLWWWLRGRHKVGVDVSVAVPYQTPAVLRVTAGPIVVSSLHGDLSVDCTSGKVALLGVDGQIRATVVSGSIEAIGCAGNLALETVSGEITVADSAPYRLVAKTVSRSLTADLDHPAHDSQLPLETISGELTIRIREDNDLFVDLSAAHGRVTSSFPDLSVEGRWGTAAARLPRARNRQPAPSALFRNISLLPRP